MHAKILIVDDDEDITTMLEDRLQASGYGTLVAGDGLQALEKVEQEAPHLMLLDLDMPRLGGLDVLKRLPSVKHAEDIPVIVMTAHGSIEAAVEAMKHGAYDFLTKPLDKDHLLIVIAKALERASLKRQVACLKSEVDSRYAQSSAPARRFVPCWKRRSGPPSRMPVCSSWARAARARSCWPGPFTNGARAMRCRSSSSIVSP
jgi:DNA-binding NtrC family response regulator